MALPTHPVLHRVILEIAAEVKKTVSAGEILAKVTKQLSLTQDDLDERTSTGASRIRANIGFGLSYIARAGLLQRPERGQYEITDEGRTLLLKPETWLSFSMLRRLIDGEDGIEQKRSVEAQVPPPKPDDSEPEEYPDEKMEDGYRAIRENLISDLLASLLEMSPDGFERLVLVLLEKLRYGKGKVVGSSGDGGIDVIINQDALGLEKVYVQAKRWRNQVGGPQIRDFSGGLQLRGAAKGVFVTTSEFTKSARESAEIISQSNQTILLIDGQELASLMFDKDVGVITEQTYAVKKLDANFFAEI